MTYPSAGHRPPRPHSGLRVSLPGFDGIEFVSLPAAEAAGAGPLSRLPYSMRVLAEHVLRQTTDGRAATANVAALVRGDPEPATVPFLPRRILMQDASGLPVLADLIALRAAVRARGGDPRHVRPRLPMDLVVDHAVEVDHWGTPRAAAQNLALELERHRDRYRFLRWARTRLTGLRVFPPGAGICHQLNLEQLAEVVSVTTDDRGRRLAGFDSVLGTDSHTTMINALSVFGWGVGGIEATGAVLGEPIALKAPEVLGLRLTGGLRPGVLATDVALSLTAVLREHGVVQKIVEFCGPGLHRLTVPDRATVSNMAPEYGATMAFFPADEATLAYLTATGRTDEHVALVRAYLQAQGMLRTPDSPEPDFDDVIEFDLSTVRATVAGPHRPNQRLTLAQVPASFPAPSPAAAPAAVRPAGRAPADGDVVIASITSCTNTSNPRALVAAGLLARNAVLEGLTTAPWVKTSFAPGSRTAGELLTATGLQNSLDQLGFHVVGHGCTTCMGNSGPLDPALEQSVRQQDLQVAAVISGNRNFEGRIHPSVKLGYLASPPLVVAFALAGTVAADLETAPIGRSADGREVRLADLWPSDAEIDEVIALATAHRSPEDLERTGPSPWDNIEYPTTEDYDWDTEEGLIRRPPFLDDSLTLPQITGDIHGARPLLLLGDAVTTDHISPVSRITTGSEAGRWLGERGVPASRFASFSARRLNHDVMVRGAFANPRLRNLLVDTEGGITRLFPDGTVHPVCTAAALYAERQEPVVVVAGEGYGAGSARDWAAKATRLLGVRAVIARGFERIHRTNLTALGVLPLHLPPDVVLDLSGEETFDLIGAQDALRPGGRATLRVHRDGRLRTEVTVHSSVMTEEETGWLRHGGLLPKILAHAMEAGTATEA
ncbi:aconitate hydratase AcnA [Streptomyces sp. NPDC047017]|uniref:aconitate hydratase AcnA n=1 Tax=Streptomyces sp. NPDC047017 TaxID=3155024 RepID=UPI0033D868BE